MMFNEVYRLVSQVFIRCEAYVFIRLESRNPKASEPIFVYVIMQIVNKKDINACRPTTKKVLWGNKIH
jgi:hypothetical protein